GLAPGALRGGARQHAVFRGHPAAALVLEPRRQPVLERGGHQHMGVAELHEAGALGIFHHAALERYGAQLVGLSAAWPHACTPARRTFLGKLLGGRASPRVLGVEEGPDKGRIPLPAAIVGNMQIVGRSTMTQRIAAIVSSVLVLAYVTTAFAQDTERST